jgi:hypothetical protein
MIKVSNYCITLLLSQTMAVRIFYIHFSYVDLSALGVD